MEASGPAALRTPKYCPYNVSCPPPSTIAFHLLGCQKLYLLVLAAPALVHAPHKRYLQNHYSNLYELITPWQ